MTVIDESHVTIPQIRAMYNGDSSRKRTLVEHGFRLPSALDNRPLRFEEFLERTGQTVYLSATPADYELNLGDGVVVGYLMLVAWRSRDLVDFMAFELARRKLANAKMTQ